MFTTDWAGSPISVLPSLGSIQRSIGGETDLQLADAHDLTAHYVRTLAAWRRNVARHEDEIRGLGYPERFLRLWDYYLAYCEAGFAERYIGTVQMTLAKPRCVRPPILPARETLAAGGPS